MSSITQGAENSGMSNNRYATRTPELRRKNKRVAIITVGVALLLFIGAIIYVTYFGGVNKGPMKPLHSGLTGVSAEFTA